ncbi:MAG: EF-P beta-lysylation protein EpmB [Chromatiales bacterium]|jgi:EF-P beta-lysylation protein EpmB
MSEAFTELPSLLAFLELEPRQLDLMLDDSTGFGLRVPQGFAAQMRKGDPADPLLLQVLPSAQEQLAVPGFAPDPVGDLQAQAVPGILHKYHGRALIMATGACAVHCRYCFRRHYPYTDGIAAPRRWQAILEYLQADRSIREVILSGGDPLLVSDTRLAEWIRQLADIQHLQRLRLHTRLPVVLPQRVTSELLELLCESDLSPVVVLHVNHPNELSQPVLEAIASLKGTGALLLNQSVLLRRVNDSAEVLASLSERLFASGVLPYYLHLLDRVQGAAHFEVVESHALELYRLLLTSLPGYMVPKLVREMAGRASKTPMSG